MMVMQAKIEVDGVALSPAAFFFIDLQTARRVRQALDASRPPERRTPPELPDAHVILRAFLQARGDVQSGISRKASGGGNQGSGGNQESGDGSQASTPSTNDSQPGEGES